MPRDAPERFGGVSPRRFVWQTVGMDIDPIAVSLPPATLAALDAWIARSKLPHPTRAEAVALLLAGALGSHAPSTAIPNVVTGRDIV